MSKEPELRQEIERLVAARNELAQIVAGLILTSGKNVIRDEIWSRVCRRDSVAYSKAHTANGLEILIDPELYRTHG